MPETALPAQNRFRSGPEGERSRKPAGAKGDLLQKPLHDDQNGSIVAPRTGHLTREMADVEWNWSARESGFVRSWSCVKEKDMTRSGTMSLMLMFALGISAAQAATRIPVLYSTDLHHPHMDPDDHFDLATLFSLPELDVQGIVLDCGSHQRKAPGSIPVNQMLHLTGRQVPFAIGLGHPLRSPDDDGCDQPAQFQHAVTLILDVLRRSPERVTVFTTGSLRDVAAAFNRDPELLRRKVARLYINIGNPATGEDSRQYEYNVKLDRNAYCSIMNSGLPIYWCPCFDGGIWQRGRHGTYWKFVQSRVLETAPGRLQNWFIYALTKPKGVDPVAFLTMPQDPDTRARVWKMPRNMWCTGPFVHAAGRRTYQRPNGDYVALPPTSAKQQGLADKTVDVFAFAPVRITATCDEEGTVHVSMDVRPKDPNGFVFKSNSDDYDEILTTCLRNLLLDVGLNR